MGNKKELAGFSPQDVTDFMADDDLYIDGTGSMSDDTLEYVAIPKEILAGKDKSFVSSLKARMLKLAMEKILGSEEVPTKAPWKSKINAMGLFGAAMVWAVPTISQYTGIQTDTLYEVGTTVFGGAIIAVRTWFTDHLIK